MFSIISFGNVRMSGMKSPVMSYAALGVGLAVMLTVGLTAIAGIVEQPALEMQEGVEERTALKAPAREMTGQADVASETEHVAPSTEEKFGTMEARELVVEEPKGLFNGFSVAIPYIAAGIVGSVVFVVTRKRIGL